MANFDRAILTVLAHEGRYVNNANDPGGPTNFGISLYWLKSASLLDHDLALAADVNHDGRIDIADIKALTIQTAEKFYKAKWWDHYHYDLVNDDIVATKIFDTAVNTGGIQAHKMLQRALIGCGTTCQVDGILGPKTIASVNAVMPVQLLQKFRQCCADFYISLASRKPKFQEFLSGWLRRAAS